MEIDNYSDKCMKVCVHQDDMCSTEKRLLTQAQGAFLRGGGVQAVLEDTRFQSIGKQSPAFCLNTK